MTGKHETGHKELERRQHETEIARRNERYNTIFYTMCFLALMGASGLLALVIVTTHTLIGA